MTIRYLLPAFLMALAGCTMQRELPDHPGAAGQIRTYYDQHAFELNASCTNPRINTITDATVIQDTPAQLVLNVRYRYEPFNETSQYGVLSCRDWGRRTFTFQKIGGALQLTGMSGDQRR